MPDGEVRSYGEIGSDAEWSGTRLGNVVSKRGLVEQRSCATCLGPVIADALSARGEN